MPTPMRVSLLLVFLTSSLLAGEAGSLLVSPVVVQGDLLPTRHFQTTFRILNLTDRAITLRVEGVSNDGEVERIFCPGPVVGGPERTFFLAPDGVINEGGGGSAFNGWARITSDEADLAASVQVVTEVSIVEGQIDPCPGVICHRPSSEVFSSVQLPAVNPANRFRSQGIITPHRESAFAIVNPSDQDRAHIQILARRPNGDGFDSTETVLEPGARISLLLFDLLILNKNFIVPPVRPTDYHGSVEIVSDIPIAVSGIQVLLPQAKLLNLPVEAL